jgi:chromate transporter
MLEPPKPSLLDIAVAFMNVGLISVGGAATPLRHMVVKQRRWATELEFAELQGLAQAFPGAVGVNIAVMIGDRLAGPAGALAAIGGLIIPSLVVAVVLASVALQLAAANPRFAAAESSITAAVAGMFLANGFRLIQILWRQAPDRRVGWRSAQVAIAGLGIALVAVFHVAVPVALIVLVVASIGLDLQRRVDAAAAA